VVGVAAAFALSDILIRMPALWWWVTRSGPIRMLDLYLSAAPFAAGAAAAFAVLSLAQRLPFPNDFVQLATSAIAAYAISWTTAGLFKRGRATMSDSINLIRTELPRLMRRGRPADA
jgi:PST family polysaccharide transporter